MTKQRQRSTRPAAGTKELYLAEWSMVMDTKMAGIAVGWKMHSIVALASQEAIQRTVEIATGQPRPWIET